MCVGGERGEGGCGEGRRRGVEGWERGRGERMGRSIQGMIYVTTGTPAAMTSSIFFFIFPSFPLKRRPEKTAILRVSDIPEARLKIHGQREGGERKGGRRRRRKHQGKSQPEKCVSSILSNWLPDDLVTFKLHLK